MRLRSGFLYNILIISCIIIVLLIIIINNIKKFRGKTQHDYLSYITYEMEATSTKNVPYEMLPTKNLLNLHNFNYLLEPDWCKNRAKNFLGLMLVTSYAGHDELRSAHRQAIGSTKLQELNLLRVFLLGAIPSNDHFITQAQLINESERFGDLLQGNFIEAYRNLSYKHTMGLQWASMHKCLKPKFIIKLDDDIVYDVFHIKYYLESLSKQEKYNDNKTMDILGGYILHGKAAIRNQANKWYVTAEEYSKDIYPDYLSGWLYITIPQTAIKLVEHAYRQSSIFWIDDLWLTGLIRNDLNISLISLNDWFSANSQFLECCIKDLKSGKNLQCDYYVGPNGGNNKLLIEFIHSIEKCYYSNKCSKRLRQEHNLRDTCVTAFHKQVPDHGVGVIEKINLKK